MKVLKVVREIDINNPSSIKRYILALKQLNLSEVKPLVGLATDILVSVEEEDIEVKQFKSFKRESIATLKTLLEEPEPTPMMVGEIIDSDITKYTGMSGLVPTPKRYKFFKAPVVPIFRSQEFGEGKFVTHEYLARKGFTVLKFGGFIGIANQTILAVNMERSKKKYKELFTAATRISRRHGYDLACFRDKNEEDVEYASSMYDRRFPNTFFYWVCPIQDKPSYDKCTFHKWGFVW